MVPTIREEKTVAKNISSSGSTYRTGSTVGGATRNAPQQRFKLTTSILRDPQFNSHVERPGGTVVLLRTNRPRFLSYSVLLTFTLCAACSSEKPKPAAP